MRIGVAKEIKTDEYRVALTPAGARELVQRGHDVVVETTAGDGSAFSDVDYERAGATIGSVDSVWADSELLLKVKEPIEPEYARLREGLVLFTYLHIAADEPLTRALLASGIAAVAYETVETDDRRLPLLAPMSEIAGRLSAQAGAYFLEKPLGGRGLLLPAGDARRSARPASSCSARRDRGLQLRDHRARARRTGDDPRAVDRPHAAPRRNPLRPGQSPDVVQPRDRAVDCRHADVVIGAVLIPGARAPKLITRAMLSRDAARRRDRRRRDRPGRMHRDCSPHDTFRSCLRGRRDRPLLRRQHAGRRPRHLDEGADERDAAAYVEADRRARPCERAVGRTIRALARGVNVLDGKITHEAVAEAHGLDYTPLADVLPLAAV